MSGLKQHFIPRMILREFRRQPARKVAQVHVHRRDTSYVANVDDVAAERRFYSDLDPSGVETLDDLITRYEIGLAGNLEALRSSAQVDPKVAARVVAHLIVRGDHVRRVMYRSGGVLGRLILDMFGSVDGIAATLGLDGHTPGPRFRDHFARHLADHPILSQLQLPEPALVNLSYMLLREAPRSELEQVAGAVAEATELLRGTTRDMSREAHGKALLNSLAPKERTELLERLTWRVEENLSAAYILPDFVVLAGDGEGQVGSLLTASSDEVRFVMMPLSPVRMLVGEEPGATAPLREFNKVAATHAVDFFISSDEQPGHALLRRCIGSGLEAHLSELERELAAEFRTGKEADQLVQLESTEYWPTMKAPLFWTDCLDHERAHRAAAVVQAITEAVHQRIDISPLQEVRLAADYDAQVRSVGAEILGDNSPDLPVPSTEGWSVAYNLPVVRDGEHGIVIVLRGEFAAGLAEDPPPKAILSVLLKQLAKIGADQVVQRSLSDHPTSFSAVDDALRAYALPAWGNWLVALFGDIEPTNDAEEAMIESLEALRDELEVSRRSYRVHGDVDRLLQEVLPIAGSALARAARIAASPDRSYAVEECLDSAGLANWFELLRADLCSIWQLRFAPPEPNAFLVLNRHLERLLMIGGLFFWQDGAQARVEVPFWSDLDWMLTEIAEGRAPIDLPPETMKDC